MRKYLAISLTLLIAFLCVAPRVHAQDALLSITASPATAQAGDTITLTVSVSSTTEAMNAVSGSVLVPSSATISALTMSGSIVSFWTQTPRLVGNHIVFEGVVLNPGYQGPKGRIFEIQAVVHTPGSLRFLIDRGAVLANDGMGTNILGDLGSASVAINVTPLAPGGSNAVAVSTPFPPILPVITNYSAVVAAGGAMHLQGKGAPGAVTKIVFDSNQPLRSLGERFIDALQSKKKGLNEVIVQNDPATGMFEYTSPDNIVAGAYNATPYLFDPVTNAQTQGVGVHLLVNNSFLVRILVLVINILLLLIPIVALIMLIYFIPWYSRRRMRILKEKMALEEEKIHLSEKELLHQEKGIDT